MTFKPAFITPIYNHGESIRPTVESLLAFHLPIYVTDDGSDEETQRKLMEVTLLSPLVRFSRLPQNRGKGAAVMDAMRRAWHDHHTHVLQIDADGQHDFSDIPRFLEAARSHPDAVIAGQALFDDTVPKSRLYGRFLTHFWVWIETLSFAIRDSLCGFRIYPLAETIRLMNRTRIPTRMDFDIAIIVRLFWAGVSVVNLTTRVTYPKDGVSHFDVWADNLRISRTHTALFFGMLPRVPLLFWRRWRTTLAKEKKNWSKMTERGTLLGLRIVSLTYRFLGRRGARILLLPVTLYFFLTGSTARRASIAYLRRVYSVFGPLPQLPHPPGWTDGFRHFYSFAESALDKFAAWFDRETGIRVEFTSSEAFSHLLSSGRGAVLIGAHLGNLEMSRAVGVSSGLSGINAVVYTDHSVRFTAMLREINPRYSLNLIQVSSLGPEIAILLHEKIEQGELIFIVGDRVPVQDNGRICRVPFLGREAPFPQGPFLLASNLGCPVYLFFCLKEGEVYRIYLEPFADCIRLPRQGREEALASLVGRFAQRLEDHCSRAPLQWFNFFDFWGQVPKTTRAGHNA